MATCRRAEGRTSEPMISSMQLLRSQLASGFAARVGLFLSRWGSWGPSSWAMLREWTAGGCPSRWATGLGTVGWWGALLAGLFACGCDGSSSRPVSDSPQPRQQIGELADPRPQSSSPQADADNQHHFGAERETTTRFAQRASQPENNEAAIKDRSQADSEPAEQLDAAEQLAWLVQTLDGAVYLNGQEAGRSSILESLGGGVGIFDYDRDGAFDVCLTGGGQFAADRLIGLPTRLFQNRATVPVEQPQASGVWWEVGSHAGLSSTAHYSHGVVAADLDEDGFCDVLVTGYGGLQLYRNQGDGTFEDRTAVAELHDPFWSSSAAWSDFNGDGWLDLYVAHYVDWSFTNDPRCPGPSPAAREVCGPKDFSALPDRLYLSLGDGRFRDASDQFGLRTDGKGLGVVAADLDQDGDIDLYVANDTTDNFLYLNEDQRRFKEAGLAAGVAVDGNGIANGSMGVELLDYNLDGRPDLCVANYERETSALYRNEGEGQFLYVSKPTGLAALGSQFVSFGIASGDWDADGDEDLVIVNGHVIKYPHAAPRRQQPVLLENQAARRFERRQPRDTDFFQVAREGRGLAKGDLDGDGDLDLVATHLNEPAQILWNQQRSGSGLTLELIGTRSSRQPLGAWCRLLTSQGSAVRMLTGGGSYLSTHAPQLVWNFPPGTTIKALEIHWPSGQVQILEQLVAGERLRIREPMDALQAEPESERR